MKFQLLLTLVASLFVTGCSINSGENQKISNNNYAHWYQVPTGKPVKLVFASYKTTMIANGTDEALLRISAVDSNGMEIMDASLPFEVSVAGEATIFEMDHSEPEIVSKTDSVVVWKSQLSNGIKELLLKSGTTVDKIKVEVKTDSLWPASHEIHTIPADVVLLKPKDVQIIPSPKIEQEMIGADISFLPQLEYQGMKFYDNGEENDAIEILKNHGFNTIRLRIFVNPENENGYAPDQGFCGLDSTLMMARRVKEAGLNLLLDFHYSDTWADPQKQFKPEAWEGLPFEKLTMTLKDYTKSVLLQLKEQGTMPDMVQVGNEINHGIVWPEGHISNLDSLAELLKAGVQGVREVDTSIIVMMHLALGGQNEETVFWFDNMIARGVEFDIIGLSYYPQWHCTLDDLNNNMLDITKRYKKDVNVVEYSAFKREVHDLVFNLPNERGNGTCIWEPLNTWSRIFDRQGNSLEEINIYDEMNAKYLTD
jgi:beta-galactosidase